RGTSRRTLEAAPSRSLASSCCLSRIPGTRRASAISCISSSRTRTARRACASRRPRSSRNRCSRISRRSAIQRPASTSIFSRGPTWASSQLLQPGIDLTGEHLHPLHRLLVVEEARLAHHEELAEAADVLVHPHDLPVDGVGVAGEDQPVLHESFERRVLEHLVDAGCRAL